MLKEPGLQAILRIFETFEGAKEETSLLLVHMGRFNAVELFTEKLISQMNGWCDYATFCQAVFHVTHNT